MAAAVGNAPTMSGSKPDAVTCWLSGYNVRSVSACHRQAAEISYLGFVESATTDFPPRAFTSSLAFKVLY